MNINKLHFFVFAVLIMLSSCSVAYGDNENIRFQRLALEEGLSQEYVLAAFQDTEGYMWFGTQEGLNRYDGYQFKVFTYNARNDNSLSSDWVFSIAEMPDNKLWIGTKNGINVFDKLTQTFTFFQNQINNNLSLSNNVVRVLYRASNGQMWVGTDGGLNLYDPQTNTFNRIDLTEYSANGSVKISSIAEGKDGQLWVAGAGIGIVRFDPATLKVTLSKQSLEQATGVNLQKVKTLLVDTQNRLWVGKVGTGVSVIDLSLLYNAPKNSAWQPAALENAAVAQIYQDRDSRIWLATNDGLFRLNADQNTFLHLVHEQLNPYSLSGQNLTCLFEDRGGVFWVGSYSGLNKWNTATANFDHIRVNSDNSKSLSGNYVTAFQEGKNQQIWISSLEGLDRLDVLNNQIAQIGDLAGDSEVLLSKAITALHWTGDSTLWVGYRDKGMSKIDTSSMTAKHFFFDQVNQFSIGANGVTTIKSAGAGKLWVGTYGGGLNLFDIETEVFIRYQHDENNVQTIANNNILSIERASNGLLWLGLWGGGLNIFNPTTTTVMRIPFDESDPYSIGSDLIWSVFEDSKGNMWLGTHGGGLAKISASNIASGEFRFERVDRYQGLPSNVVYGILEDESGYLWLSSNRGLTKLDPQTMQLVNYDSSHGLQGNEFNSGAYFKSSSGKLYFGGSNGVAAFEPSQIAPNQHVPPVVLTKFQRLNEVISIESDINSQNKIQISHKDYLIAFEFAGLDFASPNNNRYMYKLIGFDDTWIEAGDIRKATYTNLPAGNYVFRVKASNNDGIWNEQGADVALTVLPAPWYSWWAYTIYSAIALALFYWVYRSYLNKLEKEANYRHELEQEVKNRTVELRAANEQLLNASITDQLTGLHNRRYLNSIVEQQCASVFREFKEHSSQNNMHADDGPRLFFLMFDLDGFKPINDTYGHEAGDKVIRQVSELLKTVCRKSDTVIRWGGDEFLVMGRVEEVAEIEMLAERLRDKISSYGFDIDLKQKMHLSCSIGYSTYPFSHHYPDSLSWEQVHLLADNALYKSKASGRNQWTGILQSVEMPPVNIMNTLTQNIDRVIGEGYVRIKQANQDSTNKILDISTRRR